MMNSWFFAPSVIVEKVALNKSNPIYDFYIFHTSLKGKCNLVGKARVKVFVSFCKECPDLRDDKNWIQINKSQVPDFFVAEKFNDLNQNKAHLFRHLVARVDLTSNLEKKPYLENGQYFAFKVQFRHNLNNTDLKYDYVLEGGSVVNVKPN